MITMDKQYRTRDGYPVRLLCVDGPGRYPVVGIFLDEIETWTSSGSWSFNDPIFDLIEVKPKIRVERWINIVKYDDGEINLYDYDTMQSAKEIDKYTSGTILAHALHFVWEGEEP